MDTLDNRRQAINTLHEYLNKYRPIVSEHIAKHGYKLKKNGSLFEKDHKAIKALLPEFPKGRVWIRCSEYSKPVIEVDIYYNVSENCVNYYKRSYYMDSNETLRPLPTYTLEEFRTMQTKMEWHKEQYENHEGHYRHLKNILTN